MQPRKSRFVPVAIILMLCFWALAGITLFGRNAVFDWWRLQGYVPSAEVEALANDTTMNDTSRRLFYAYHPSIEAGTSFNKHCRDSEYTIVLGCYRLYDGIYIFNIDDERLRGVQEVTAAHELLHAGYDRLSGSERERVDTLLMKAYKDLRDARIQKTVAQYEEKDPGSVPSELHSILGTEVRDLPEELEEYYKKYFTDRSKVVAYSEHYESAFSSRKSQIENLEKELESLKAKVDTANKDLASHEADLSTRGAGLKQRAANGSASQQEIDEYNNSVSTFNAKIASTNRLVDSYNSKRQQYLKLVGEQNDLFKEIDSRQGIVAQ